MQFRKSLFLVAKDAKKASCIKRGWVNQYAKSGITMVVDDFD